jgi:transcriptional regulator with GAF, ATPase, and Fis domain
LIWEVTELLRQSISIDEVLEKVLKHIMTSLPRIDTGVILLYDQRKEEIVGNFSTERFENVMEEVPYSKTIVDRVIKSGKAIRMSDTKYEAAEDISDSINDLNIKSIMCVPLISNEEILGVIYVDSRGVYGFRKDDLLLLNSLSGPIAVAVEKAVLASELEAVPFVVD